MFFANGQLQTTFTPCCGHKMDELWTGWQKHCFTWNSGVSFKVQSYKPVCNGECVLDSFLRIFTLDSTLPRVFQTTFMHV